jgi:hypothetical protein
MKEQEERIEEISCNKPDHLLRSIANEPNHLKSKKVKELLKEHEVEEANDTKNLGC